MNPTALPIHRLLDTPVATAWFTERGDFIEKDAYSGFNLCHYTGDAPAHYQECREALCRLFNISPESLIIPRQTHSNRVLTITQMPVTTQDLEGVDGIVTALPDVIIGINTADCVPLVMIDTCTGICGTAHAGWRGAVGGIVENTLKAMYSLGASPRNIIAAIGPSICVNCFEVGPEVASQFPESCVDRTTWAKPHVNLQKYVAGILAKDGITLCNQTTSLQPENDISVNRHITGWTDELCTRHHPDIFFSARQLGISSGRLFTFIRTTKRNP